MISVCSEIRGDKEHVQHDESVISVIFYRYIHVCD